MLFGEVMTLYDEIKLFPEDMSTDGLLTIVGVKKTSGPKDFTYSEFILKVKPSEKSESGSIEFCNSGTRYSDRKIHSFLKRVLELMKDLPENSEFRRLRIKVGDDGDIRVFITEKPTDRLVLNPKAEQKITFSEDKELPSVFRLLCHWFNYEDADLTNYRFT
jgi:hypothetical protein